MLCTLHLCILVLDNFKQVPYFNFAIPAGASVSHRHISRCEYDSNECHVLFVSVVERGEITWDDDDNWEVERILDHVVEDVNIIT